MQQKTPSSVPLRVPPSPAGKVGGLHKSPIASPLGELSAKLTEEAYSPLYTPLPPVL